MGLENRALGTVGVWEGFREGAQHGTGDTFREY